MLKIHEYLSYLPPAIFGCFIDIVLARTAKSKFFQQPLVLKGSKIATCQPTATVLKLQVLLPVSCESFSFILENNVVGYFWPLL